MKKSIFTFALGFITAVIYLIACNGQSVTNATVGAREDLVGSWSGTFYIDALDSNDAVTFELNADDTYSCTGFYQDDPDTFAGNVCAKPVSWELIGQVIRLVYTGPDDSQAQALLPILYSTSSRLQIVMSSQMAVSTSLLDLNK